MLLSVFMLTLNEEEMLPGCLERLGRRRDGGGPGVAEQIVVVDSGSTDDTVAIAREYGCEVLEWRGGSASPDVMFTPEGPAYNMALEACQGEWVMLLAADERLCQRAAAQLRDVLSSASQDNVAMWGAHFLAPSYYSAQWLSRVPGRLVRRDPAFRFDPEQMRGLLFPLVGNGQVLELDMALLHHYYFNRYAKTEKYYRLQGRSLDSIEQDIKTEQAQAVMRPWPPASCSPQCQRCFLAEVKQ